MKSTEKKGVADWNVKILQYIEMNYGRSISDLAKELNCSESNIYEKKNNFKFFTPEQAIYLYRKYQIPFEKTYLNLGSFRNNKLYQIEDNINIVAEEPAKYGNNNISILISENQMLKQQILDKDKIINLLEQEKKGK